MKVVSVNEGGTPSLKSDSINKLVKLNENLDLCDIWGIRNPQKCKYISRQKYPKLFSDNMIAFLSHKISRNLSENLKNVLNSLSTDHSSVFCSISKQNEFNKVKGKACGCLITL